MVLFLVYHFFSNRSAINGDIVEVLRGEVIKEIFEAGTIKRGEEINLSFGGSGKIEKISFREGDSVKKGEEIASLDKEALSLNLIKAEGALRIAEINLQKLRFGGSSQDIRFAQTAVDNAKESHESAIHNLEKTINIAEERMENVYRESLPILNEIILTAESAYTTAESISQIHFSVFYTEDARKVIAARDRIKEILDKIISYRNEAVESRDWQAIDNALLRSESGLKVIFTDLDVILKILEKIQYRDSAQTEITLIISEKSSVNNFSASVSSLIGSISMAKLLGESEISLSETHEKLMKGALEQTLNEFSRTSSSARSEDLDLAEIQVSQARSEVRLLQKAIEESVIIAPFNGRILRINSRAGEAIQAGLPVFSMVPDDSYQTEVNIYEGDIAEIKVGNPVEIEIVAFPGKTFQGEVIFIEYGSRIIDGVVYYRALTDIRNYPENIMFGMTADVTIIPEKRIDVLFLPESAIGQNNTVILIDNGQTSEVTIERGLRGSNRMVEIISGVNEGDKVMIPR